MENLPLGRSRILGVEGSWKDWFRRVCMYVCMYIYIYIFIYVFINICIYIYTQVKGSGHGALMV